MKQEVLDIVKKHVPEPFFTQGMNQLDQDAVCLFSLKNNQIVGSVTVSMVYHAVVDISDRQQPIFHCICSTLKKNNLCRHTAALYGAGLLFEKGLYTNPKGLEAKVYGELEREKAERENIRFWLGSKSKKEIIEMHIEMLVDYPKSILESFYFIGEREDETVVQKSKTDISHNHQSTMDQSQL